MSSINFSFTVQISNFLQTRLASIVIYFHFVLNNEKLCTERHINIITIVHSTPTNFEARQIIRQSMDREGFLISIFGHFSQQTWFSDQLGQTLLKPELVLNQESIESRITRKQSLFHYSQTYLLNFYRLFISTSFNAYLSFFTR